ncbi:MAG: OmpA family protein [Deltaproteobacteria bacterium]|nr:OmpA family protein [Deltaproteobacteria bacterium]
MGRNFKFVLIFMVAGALLFGCATAPPPLAPFSAADLNARVKAGQLQQKTAAFLVILDASGSMAQGGKLEIAKNFVNRFNQTIPKIRLQAGLRKVAGTNNPFIPSTARIYGMTDYSKQGLEDAVSTIQWAKGETPLTSGINEAIIDLEAIDGNIAVIVVSDGRSTEGDPVPAAKALKAAYGDRVCIYSVLVGNDLAGSETMVKIAKAGRCGFTINAADTASPAQMARYVERVFFKGGFLDSDGDGVPNNSDLCPATPKGVKVDKDGCALDSDGDLVPDYLDQCPNTPRGVRVDYKGCPISGIGDADGDGIADNLDRCPNTPYGAKVNAQGCWVLGEVLFAFDKADIKPQYSAMLDSAVKVMKRNPDLKIEIQGHTDSIGGEAYNQSLSARRAKAVLRYFADKGVNVSRMKAVGYGLTRPVATNKTREGRAQNRRVELAPVAWK